MGKESGSWLRHQQLSPWQLANLNCTDSLPDTGRQITSLAYTNPNSCMGSANASLPGFPISEFPRANGWFYCLPRHRQALTPTQNFAPKMFSAFPNEYGGEAKPNVVSTTEQNRFLVFDQSGNHASLILSSLIGSPGQHPGSGDPKSFGRCGFCAEVPTIKTDPVNQAGAVISDGADENREESEMHEDTEELNALLYSDDDDYDDDDYDEEETSTGHSPSEMMGNRKREEIEENAEGVASSAGPTKRKRWLDEEHDVPSLMDTASSGAANGTCKCEDDTESSCGDRTTQGRDMGLLPANKRLKRERIKETVSILQSMIPGGKGKDAMLVMDEAIQYLKLLKLKVKSLGEIL